MLSKKKKILIIGAAGGLARILTSILSKRNPDDEIIGVDSRPQSEEFKRDNVQFLKIKYTRGNFEKLFRDNEFYAVYHLARMSHAYSNKSNLAQRLDLNIMGTSRILELALKFHVKKMIILSTYHVYGALSDNSTFLKEDAPLKASINHPELRDVTEMDQLATNWMWKNQHRIETVVLRPCSIIGPQIRNSMSQYLTTKYVPLGIDYNPMFQFIHEFDMANILSKSLDEIPTGIYNVAPDEVVSLRKAKELIGLPSLRLPLITLTPMTLAVKKIWNFPDYLIEYIKFSCIIDNTELKKHLKKDFLRFSTKEALELLKLKL
ncbi:NAD-dependent epimerase/dehydratase family protein [Halobacteriovorax sp.]|uniref:NAD-dependent epimerase/dehydratase family protein n=1 Tax=Halobacteriovorax sp. TaxID=2020862 RepID=UPI0035678338